MQAVIFNQYGGPEVLELVDIPQPTMAANQVLVRVKAVGLNPKDAALRAGMLKFLTGKRFPQKTGFDFSGVIVAVGDQVKNHQIGEEVFGYIEDLVGGAAAEFVAVKQDWIATKPAAIAHVEAAAMPCTYLTALQALRQAKLQRGQKIFIYGASGGVGTAAIQIAKHLGAVVTAVSSGKNQAYCAALAADKTLAYDQSDVFGDTQEKYDVFFQVHVLSGNLYSQARKILKREGVFITIEPNPLLGAQGFIRKLLGQPRLESLLVKSNQQDLEAIARMAEQGVLQPQVLQKLALSDIAKAHKIIEEQHTRGKIVLEINSD
ncbi:NAD(P)-dependent alcohol dehydrogenase [Trichocoleus sp. FACHB-262]|uniref:NAD(P)-dependent alcohol dehydrogenase n=1 Tax=Trichocoleus sp. FACHB-262 TaxID=2692869 RepID=UPI0016863544|nr:NAD(P)-dependent alcohol dehydrogenase [Trichocoleus sp. FACHB-262]MBD2124577.1 NAD(P)-dependent alcohol dehydrogenase [Trichocoleus sp. FACHB-262]